jgi:hypothetical protein
MISPMALLGPTLRLATWRSWHALEAASRNPRRTQEQLLGNLIRKNHDTRFGRDHRFGDIRSPDDFRANVAIREYEGFRPYVVSIMEGEPGVLTAEPVRLLTLTSGTTGQPKYVPVTDASARASASLTRAWLHRALADHPGMLDRDVFSVVSPTEEGRTAGGIQFGSASGRIYRDSPGTFRRKYAVPPDVFAIEDFDAKYYCLARLAVEARLSFVATPNPSTLVRLAETANAHQESIIRDIADGTLDSGFEVPADIRDQVRPRIAPNPVRARALEHLVVEHGTLRPCDYWPDLQLIGCWKGGSVGVQLDKTVSWYGSQVPRRDLGYLASEAHMSVPVSDEGAAGILGVTANFYEFLPEGGPDGEAPLLCDELEVGREYSIVVTTQAGLYRYDIHDVVRVEGFFHQTPLVAFVRKGRDMTSIGGEKLHVSQIIGAFDRVRRSGGLACAHYRVVACANENRYAFLAEIERAPEEPGALKRFLRSLDQALGDLNIEYRAKRESRRLGAPCLYVMRAGSFERLYRQRIAAGARDSQFKTTLLTTAFEPGELDETVEVIELGE